MLLYWLVKVWTVLNNRGVLSWVEKKFFQFSLRNLTVKSMMNLLESKEGFTIYVKQTVGHRICLEMNCALVLEGVIWTEVYGNVKFHVPLLQVGAKSLSLLLSPQGLGLMMVLEVTMKCREQCWNWSISWMASILEAISKCWWPLTDRILWIQHWWGPGGWTERLNLAYLISRWEIRKELPQSCLPMFSAANHLSLLWLLGSDSHL